MSNKNTLTEELLKKYQEAVEGTKWGVPPQIINPVYLNPQQPLRGGLGGYSTPGTSSPGRPVGSSLKDKDTIVQETVERLSEVIAKICNRYNLSDSVQMTTEIDLVETANYTTVILTTTVEWLPNPYVFVAQEKVKTSNKTSTVKIGNMPNTSSATQQLQEQAYYEKLNQLNLARQAQNIASNNLAKRIDKAIMEDTLNKGGSK